MSPRKSLLTLVMICKLCYAMAPLVFLFQPLGEAAQVQVVVEQATASAEPQPGGLRRLFGRRLLGQ